MRNFSVFGDSISTFEGFVPVENLAYYQGEALGRTGVSSVEETWWMRVIDRLNGSLLANASFSGSMTAGAGFPAGCSDERIAQIAGPCGEHPDDILVFMGTNDYGWGSPEAQAAARSAATPRCVDFSQVPAKLAGLASGDDLAGFEHAYGLMLQKMRRRYPESRIWCLSLTTGREEGRTLPCFTYALRGIALQEYNEAVKRQAVSHGCMFIDLLAMGFDYETCDGTHPTKRGMMQIAEMVLAGMVDGDSADLRSADLPFSLTDLFAEHMRARRWCDKPACVGCNFARGTGNQWSCVCDAPGVVRDEREV